jgi:hypothetical protein
VRNFAKLQNAAEIEDFLGTPSGAASKQKSRSKAAR